MKIGEIENGEQFMIDNHASKHLWEKIWKLDAESKFTVDILEELLFNKLEYYVISFPYRQTIISKIPEEKPPSGTLPFIFQVEVL